jgi:LysM repeat protein
MTSTAPRKTRVDFGVVTELTVADETVNLILEKTQDRNETVYRGGMIAGQRLLVVALLEELIPELDAPNSIQNLAITKLAVELRPEKGAFAFEAAIENVWSITLDSGPTLSIDRLALSVLSVIPPTKILFSSEGNQNFVNQLNGRALPQLIRDQFNQTGYALTTNAYVETRQSGNQWRIIDGKAQYEIRRETGKLNVYNRMLPVEGLSQQRKVAFEGMFQLFGGEFAVRVTNQFSSITANGGKPTTASQWIFSATANKISVSEIIKAFGFSQDQLDRYGLKSLVVSLAFTLNETRYTSNNRTIAKSNYIFRGELLWDTGIQLAPGEPLQVKAAIQVSKTSSNEPGSQESVLQGQIAGTVRASIPFFDTLQLSVIYTFAKTSSSSGASAGRSSQALATRTGELIFQLQISSLLLNAVYTSVPDPNDPGNASKNRKLLRFSVGLVSGKNPTIGDLIAYIVSLYDPSITGFELDPPWDQFANQEIALNKFSLEIDLTQKTVTISYQATLDVLIAKVSNVGLSYQFGADPSQAQVQQNNARTASNKKVAIALNLSIPGQPQQRVQWDPVNESPPDVPGTNAPIFDLQFLALGQRVAFAPEIVRQARTIQQFTNVMRQSLVPLPPIKRQQNPLTALQDALPSAVSSDPTQPITFSGQPIRFSAESGWLIGAQFSILGAIDLSVIFNDPFIYGVRISLSGPLVQSLSGFEFEILYRRISDTIGVYRAELTLPSSMRQLQFGAVSITLPSVAVAIYTNGDFEIDVGFPWGGDFSRSIAVEVLIFLGLGGFYFNKLSAATATSVPKVLDGTFNPVLEFGIGLKVGLGRTFVKGPLRAEISITIFGLLQGVFATFNPTDTSRSKATYYRVQGGVAIIGRIYGVVDFSVIQVDVEVIAKVMVLFVVEAYKAIQIALVATVSVKASIKIVFVKITFSFELTVRQEFVLGSDSTPPWRLAAASTGAMAANVPIFSVNPHTRSLAITSRHRHTVPVSGAAKSARFTTRDGATRITSSDGMATSGSPNADVSSGQGRSLRWDNGTTGTKLALPQLVRPATKEGDKLRLDIYFQPSFTKTETGVNGIGLLFIENSIPPDEAPDNDNDTDFDELVKALLQWVIYASLSNQERSGLNVDPSAINVNGLGLTLGFLEEVYALFVQYLNEEPANAFWGPLNRFLSANFIFDITDRPIDKEKEKEGINGTIFPMFPQLQMELKANDSAIGTIKFDSNDRKLSPARIKAIREFFQKTPSRSNRNQATDDSLITSATSTEELAIAELLFIDYFTLIIRSVLQLGIDHVRDKKDGVGTDGKITLGDLLDHLNGGKPFQSLAGMTSRFLLHGLRLPTFDVTGDNSTEPVYKATGQQFDAIQTRTTQTQEGETRTETITINQLRLSKPNPSGLTWIRFIDYPDGQTSPSPRPAPNPTGLNYSFGDRIGFIEALETTNGTLPTNAPDILTFYNLTPQRFTIRQEIAYQAAETSKKILELPRDLRNYLQYSNSNAVLTLKQQRPQSEAEAGQPLTETDISNYAWATKIKLTVNHVTHSGRLEVLPTTYGIERLDAADQSLLETIIRDGIVPTEINLLYLNESNSSKQLISRRNASVSILKTNLSVQASEPRSATLRTSDHYLSFLKLLLEGGTAGGDGYYLYYAYSENSEQKGLPKEIFADEKTASVTLLLTFNSSVSTSAKRYHNCILVDETVSVEAGVVAESSETTQVLRIPAGNLGFRFVRRVAEPQDIKIQANVAITENIRNQVRDEISNLYQLLSYQVPQAIANDFKVGQDRLPIGPFEEDDNEKDWVYEKVLPVYALANVDSSNSSTALPEILTNTLNPYYGIGKIFKLDFYWQDVYGNRLGADAKFVQGIVPKLGYFDPIFGVNQWPSVGESYTITPPMSSDDTAVQLNLELVFDQAKYVPTATNSLAEALDRIKTDRATYQNIYYQVHDPALKFTVSTSVISGWNKVLESQDERKFFTNFVDSVYKYLVTLESLQYYEHPISSTSEASETLQSVQTRYGVDLEDLADINSDQSILVAGASIKIPVSVRVRSSDDTLNAIATKLIENNTTANQNRKVKEIVQQYARTADLLAVGTVIPPNAAHNSASYTVLSGDTFESIAIAQLAIQEDEQIRAELNRIARNIGNTAGILADGSLFKTPAGRQTKIAFNSTLEELAYHLLRQEQEDIDINEALQKIVSLNLDIPNLLKPRVKLPIKQNSSEPIDPTVQAGQTLGQIQSTHSLTLEELTEVVQGVEGLFSDDAVRDDLLIVRQMPNGDFQRIKVEPNAKLSAIVYNFLQQEWGGVDLNAALLRKIDALVAHDSNQTISLQPGVVIPELNNYQTQAGDTLATLREKVTTVSGLSEAIRDVRGLFADSSVLVGQNVLGENVSVHLTSQNTLEAIATTVTPSLTVADLITANVDQPDLLINDDITLNEIVYTYQKTLGQPVTEAILLAGIETIVRLNETVSGLLKASVRIPQLDDRIPARKSFTTQDGDTFGTIIEAMRPQLERSEVIQALRNVKGLFSGTQQQLRLDEGQASIKIATIPLSPGPDYQVKPQDSFRRIAVKRFIPEVSTSIDVTIPVEFKALQYTVGLPQTTHPLTEITYNLNLATNSHRTVLETVRAVGTISQIFDQRVTNSTIAAQLATQLSALADTVSDVAGLFGTEDIILADVLLEYTVANGDSFDDIMAKVNGRDGQVLTDKVTAGAIALQNPTLALQAGQTLYIPDRFTLELGADGTRNQQLAIKSSAQVSSLADLAASMGDGISAAAVAIANQSRAGLLTTDSILSIPPLLSTLLGVSHADITTLVEQFISQIPGGLTSLQVNSTDTLYSLKSKLENSLKALKGAVETEAKNAQQRIGAIGAIYEQFTFAGANRTTLRDSVTSALSALRSELLTKGNLKPQFQQASMYSSPASINIAGAIDKVEDKLIKSDWDLTIEANRIQREQDLTEVQTSLKTIYQMYERSALKTAVDLLTKRSQRPLTVAEVGTAIANISGLIAPNQIWIVPPIVSTKTLPIDIRDGSGKLNYPTDLIFAVTVQVEMRRKKELMYRNEAVVPEAEAISAYFSPKTVAIAAATESADESDRQSSLVPFATDFQQALPDLQLAVGRSATSSTSTDSNPNASPSNSDALWAVHLGESGVNYNIREAFPFFFSAAPIANTLMSGTIPLYSYTSENGLDRTSTNTGSLRVDAVDLNGLARKYLQAIEDILKPEISVPAVTSDSVSAENRDKLKESLNRLLTTKADLADTISQSVTPVLKPTQSDEDFQTKLEQRRSIARDVLKKEFQVNLAKAYDIETIVQYEVDVAIASGYRWTQTAPNQIPRLSGQPTITGAKKVTDGRSYENFQSLDFALSPAKLPLDSSEDGLSHLTFFFNTQTPQSYEDIELSIAYRVNELEYNVQAGKNEGLPSSSWLSFILPLDDGSGSDDYRITQSVIDKLPTDIQASLKPWIGRTWQSKALFVADLSTVLPLEQFNQNKWLILTYANFSAPNHIGDVQIPIPLRDYPIPPSLIAHQAVPDPDAFSGTVLSSQDIRDWNYVFLYEHPDVAQDTIECQIDYNENFREQRPQITIDDVIVSESAGTATFTVSLFPPETVPVTVDYKTLAGTAVAGKDYTDVSGTLTFAPGEITQQIEVPILSDTIVEDNEAFTVQLSNAEGADIADAEGVGTIIDAPLLDALVRFNQLYPDLARDLVPLETGVKEKEKSVVHALDAFATLAEEVANAWSRWQPVERAIASRSTGYYDIDETLSEDQLTKTVTIQPNLPASEQQVLEMALPGYDEQNPMRPTIPYSSHSFEFRKSADATGVETFGESDIPDRKLTVANLDVLDYQNAWGAIRLSRNKNLIDGMTTNPAFIFQTPKVRFKNYITPFVVNNKRWDIAALSNPSFQTLEKHLEKLFETLLPAEIKRPYDIRIACEYAFALTLGELGSDDSLLAKLPVLLVPRFSVRPSVTSEMLTATTPLRENIAKTIMDWQKEKDPNAANGELIFSVSLFSNADTVSSTDNLNLPLLMVENLCLKLSNITPSPSNTSPASTPLSEL